MMSGICFKIIPDGMGRGGVQITDQEVTPISYKGLQSKYVF